MRWWGFNYQRSVSDTCRRRHIPEELGQLSRCKLEVYPVCRFWLFIAGPALIKTFKTAARCLIHTYNFYKNDVFGDSISTLKFSSGKPASTLRGTPQNVNLTTLETVGKWSGNPVGKTCTHSTHPKNAARQSTSENVVTLKWGFLYKNAHGRYRT